MAGKFLPLAALIASLAFAAQAGEQVQNPLTDSEMWDMLREDVVGSAPIHDGSDLLTLDAPYRAHDAATVPILLKQTDTSARIRKATVVIDENPAPVAAELGFSDAMAPLDFELRVRVNQYSNIRVIAETDDGLHMTGRFVKASGGCSAPASRDPEVALASMGKMKLKRFLPAARPDHPIVHPRPFHRPYGGLAGRGIALYHGWRHLDLGKPGVPVLLQRQRIDRPARDGHRYRRQPLRAGAAQGCR
jgi:sulfur-oxidizing protein SoxY